MGGLAHVTLVSDPVPIGLRIIDCFSLGLGLGLGGLDLGLRLDNFLEKEMNCIQQIVLHSSQYHTLGHITGSCSSKL